MAEETTVAPDAISEQTIADAYIYLLCRALVIRASPNPTGCRLRKEKTLLVDIQNLRSERVGQAGRVDPVGGDQVK